MQTSGNSIALPRGMLGGGEIEGLIRFRDDDLAAAQARLGQLAAALAEAYNTQQSLGRDPSGTAGAPLFAYGTATVGPASTNTGSAAFSVAVATGSQLQASDYQIDYNAGAYSVTRLSDGTTTAIASWPASVDGLTLNLTGGTAQNGDRFLVKSGSAFASDFRAVISSGSRIASGLAVTTQLGQSNTGDIQVDAFSVTANGANLTQPVTITFDGAGHYSVSGTGTGNPSGLAFTPGMTISYNGWSVRLDGSPGAGDTLAISQTANPANDNRNARAMVELADRPTVAGDNFSNAFAQMLSDIGVRTQSAQSANTMSAQVLSDAKAARSEVSGVNLDEEAARLLQYQQAYQAAAKLLATAQTVFQTLLDASSL
jgi:flagellar hook-associated protein 1 FlgK